jgi:hypothetical protein
VLPLSVSNLDFGYSHAGSTGDFSVTGSPDSEGSIMMCVDEKTNCSTSNERRPRRSLRVPSMVRSRYNGLGFPEKS